MKLFRNFKIGTKILLSFGAVLAIVVALTAIINVMTFQTLGNYGEIKDQYIYLITKTGEINPEMRYIEGDINEYILTGDEETYNDTLAHIAILEEELIDTKAHIITHPKLESLIENVGVVEDAIVEITWVLEKTKYSYDALESQSEEIVELGPNWIEAVKSFQANAPEMISVAKLTKDLGLMDASDASSREEALLDKARSQESLYSNLNKSEGIANAISAMQLSAFSSINTESSEYFTNSLSTYDELLSLMDELIVIYKNEGEVASANQLETLREYALTYQTALTSIIDQRSQLTNNAIEVSTVVTNTALTIDNLADSGVSETNAIIEFETAALTTTSIVVLIAGLIAIALTVIVGISLTRSIKNPVNKIKNFANELADGNLQLQNMDVTSKDELGNLTKSINTMFDSLKTVISNINVSSDDVTNTANDLKQHAYETTKTTEEVARTVEQISEGAMEQAENTQTATDAVNKLGSIIETNATSAKSLEDSSTVIRTLSLEGVESINDLSEKTKISKDAIDEIIDVINETNESAVKIGNASQLINDIAAQTNLLALNAAIEAARAGEHGKGFAVVADEIRKLAEQSTNSTKEIDKMLNLLKASSTKAIETGESVKEIVESQVESVNDTEAKYSEIQASINHSLEQINQILGLSTEMEHSREEVVNVLESLAAIAEENAASTEETSASAEEMLASMTEVEGSSNHLSELAVELKELVSKFRI